MRTLGRLVGYADGMPLYAPLCPPSNEPGERYGGRLVGFANGQPLYMEPGCPPGLTLGRQVGFANGLPLYAVA